MKKATLWVCMLGTGLLHIQSSFAAPLLTPHLSATQVVAPQANAWVEINVQTFKGRVQLSGFVSSAADAKRAVEVTRQVQGVRVVENDMQIK